jgi:hypothetical protein
MTTDHLQKGTVFFYPYLWSREHALGRKNAKDRTCCLAYTVKARDGEVFLIIVPISDQPGDNPDDYIAVPETERQRGGLDLARPAYIHINEINFDPLEKSWNFEPRARKFGRFSRAFAEQIVGQINSRVFLRTVQVIDRRE